jgi:outer membrane receptor protein involved in Fe transport
MITLCASHSGLLSCQIRRAVLAAGLSLFLSASSIHAGDTRPAHQDDVLSDMSLEDLMKLTVVSATLHTQAIQEAPASISVISADDIQKYGYRTLAEALDSIRGLYISTDRSYSFLGARGISTPGDYGSRFLLLINGHPMPDPIYDMSGVLEERLGIDMDLIKQIEVVHGPASALYGSNAVLCTINIITRTASEMPRVHASLETGTLGEKKLESGFARTWDGASLMVSSSLFDYGGEHSIFIPHYAVPETGFGRAISMDGQTGGHFFANLTAGGWTFTAMMGQRRKIMPISYGETIFNDRGTRAFDTRSYVEALYSRPFWHGELEWRTSYDWYRFRGVYRYALNEGVVEDNREYDFTEWAGSRLTWRKDSGKAGATTLGVETRIDIQTLQSNFDVEPRREDYVHIDKPDRSTGFFAQHEIPLSKHWKAVGGARFDTSVYRRSSISPRAALI